MILSLKIPGNVVSEGVTTSLFSFQIKLQSSLNNGSCYRVSVNSTGAVINQGHRDGFDSVNSSVTVLRSLVSFRY